MGDQSNFPDRLQSPTHRRRRGADPRLAATYLAWIEEMIGRPLGQTLTLEVDADPGDAVAAISCRGFRCRQELRLEIVLGTV